MLASMNTAFEAGRRMGVLPEGSAIDCPIDHAHLMLRLSWMHGFSKGRVDPRRDQDWIGLKVWQ